MLGLFLVFALVSATFGKTATQKSRNKAAWIAIGITAFFGAQLIAGMLLEESLIQLNSRADLVLGFNSGEIVLLIAYVVLWQLPDFKDYQSQDSNILDDKFDQF